MTKKETPSSIWKKRYPNIAFLLQFFVEEEKRKDTNPEELENWLEQHPLDEIEVLYIIGLLSSIPKRIQTWLSEKEERVLVFVEEDLGAFQACDPGLLLENPQVHFQYIESDPCEFFAKRFPTDRLAVFVPNHKSFDALNLKKCSGALFSSFTDLLYSDYIAKNVLKNYERLDRCFDAGKLQNAFENIPAIICGAGPSLEKEFDILKQVGDRALIFAGGSAITSLTKNGILPHFSIALDPNEEEVERIKQAHLFEGPFLFSPRLHHEVSSLINGPFGFIRTQIGGPTEKYLETELGFSSPLIDCGLEADASTVTSLAIKYAQFLGCNPIILVGVDLSFTHEKRYAKGVKAENLDPKDPRALEERLSVRDMHGNETTTCVKWLMEKQWIENFAKTHKVQMLHGGKNGLGFEGIENYDLEEVLKNKKAHDLKGLIHQQISTHLLHFSMEAFKNCLSDLNTSLKNCSSLIQSILKNPHSPKSFVYELDLREEKAYKCFLEGVELALDHMLTRYFADEAQKKEAKYLKLLEQIPCFKASLNTY